MNERLISWTVSGSFTATVILERSFDSADGGFNKVTDVADITGQGSSSYQDTDDNINVWYRFRVSSYTSGVATIAVTYQGGNKEGIARATAYNSNTEMDVEVLQRFGDTGGAESWSIGAWNGVYGYPTAVAIHEGRVFHAGKATIWGSVSDDYQNFEPDTVGDAGPINRTLGAGPVDQVTFLASNTRLVAGTAGTEIAIRSSSLDEPLTPSNASARPFSTQGTANLSASRVDNELFFVQRSLKKIFTIGFGAGASGASDYSAIRTTELTLLVPDLLEAGVVDIAVQRQPETRLHCALEDGRVAILTYEPQEEVVAWSMWETDTGLNSKVERIAVLPEGVEDGVYYHVQRTVNGVKKRFIEKWALETEGRGDTGLTWLSDCAVSQTTDTGRTDSVAVNHLIGAKVVAWANDTGQANSYGKDLSGDDTGGVQKLYTVGVGGNITLEESVKHAVAGLGYQADWKSSKLAYGAQAGSALAQMKRIDKLAMLLHETHNNAIFFGSDTGDLDPMPRVSDNGAEVDKDKVFTQYDDVSVPFPGNWDTDSRAYVRAKSPRPATVLALIPTVNTNEKI